MVLYPALFTLLHELAHLDQRRLLVMCLLMGGIIQATDPCPLPLNDQQVADVHQ